MTRKRLLIFSLELVFNQGAENLTFHPTLVDFMTRKGLPTFSLELVSNQGTENLTFLPTLVDFMTRKGLLILSLELVSNQGTENLTFHPTLVDFMTREGLLILSLELVSNQGTENLTFHPTLVDFMTREGLLILSLELVSNQGTENLTFHPTLVDIMTRKGLLAKTEEQIAAEEAWCETEKVWLVHKDGFSLASQLKSDAASALPEGKVKVKLDYDGAANPPSCDRLEDLANLEETSPHVYALAQAAYRAMLMSRQDQSLVFLGSSGSGKSTSAQHLVQYLATIAGSPGRVFSVEKWQALYTILEAFGNSSTSLNSNASRFSQIISLDFDQAGQVASASVQTMLLEKLRVAKRPTNEGTFNVFYYLLACPDNALRTELHFNHLAENNVFGILPLSKPEEKQKAAQQFSRLQAAMKVMGISGEEQKAFWLVLGAICHLGAAGATKGGRKQFARHEWAQKAAYLLGSNLEELSSAIFKQQQPKGSLQRSTSFRQGPEEAALADGSGPKTSALECLEALTAGLYSELFTLLISLLNRALKSSQCSLCSMMIVDTPGLQNPETAGQSRGATFEELCHNYAQERLQGLFHERTFVQELERYKEENLDLSLDALEPSVSGSVATVDEASHQALVSPNPLLRSNKPRHFFLGHSYGTNWVEYDTTGWLSYVRQNPASQNSLVLLQESQKKIISSLFAGRAGANTVLSGSIAGLEGGSQLALRRATSMRKTFTTGVAGDALIDTLKKSKLHFVHCFLPKASAWRGDAKGPYARRVSSSEPDLHGEHCEAGLMQLEVPLLRAQIRGSRLLDALRMYRQGYPDHMVFAEFRRRFEVLAPHLSKKHGRHYIVTDEKRAVEELLQSLELEQSCFQMGVSRIQDLAIRCVQKNIKKNKGVKGWPWWKLFTTVRPLIEVQLTEDQIRAKDVAELTSELTDERNTGESASQLLDVETAERLRGEKDMKDLQAKYDALKKQMDSMEMEVMEARLIRAAELNGEMDDDDTGGEWRLKYERASREIDFTKKRLQQEFEDKLEVEQQSKRQLERRLTDLQADSEETQRALHTLRKKFDGELSQAHEEAQREKQGREKLGREKDMLIAEVFGLKQQLEEKEAQILTATQKVQALEAELHDLSSQESKDEASLAKVRKQLRDLEAQAKDQEEELDEQAGTIQVLEQMERLRQTHTKEVESRDEEVEEVRQSCQKKLKQLELQLEEAYEEKQKVSQRDFEAEKRLRKDLKRTKALLADAQLEESEFTCSAAVKARKSMEVEIEDLHLQIEDFSKAKGALEEQLSRLQREKNEVQSRLEEDQEDMNELMKKHKAAVAQASRDLGQINDLQSQLEDAQKEKQELQEKLQGLQSQVEFLEQTMVDKSLVSRQEAKIRELETRLEFERTQVKRLESLATRLKENMEKLTEERDQRTAAENREKEQNKRLQRQLRDTKEEMAEVAKKEAEASRKKHELEMDLESLEAANQSLQADLKLAFKRIGDLQAAIEDEMDSEDNEDLINSEGDSDADSELEDRVDGVKSWLSKNKGSCKSVSEDGSLKSSRPTLDATGKEAKNGEDRPASVMSSLSYRKRTNLKDSIGGKGDEESLFSALSERPASPDRSFRKAARASVAGGSDESSSLASWKKPLGGGLEELSDRGSVLSETSSRLAKGLEKRWSTSAAEFDRTSVLSATVSQSAASWAGLEDDTRSSLSLALSSPGSSRRSASRLDDLSSSYGRPGSRISLSRSQLDDTASLAPSDSRSLCSQHSVARSLSMPPRPRTSTSDDLRLDDVDIRPVGHRSYLDPDLEAAISEVLNYKPVKFRRSSRDPDSEEEDRRSVRSARSTTLLETAEHPASSLRRSASALDFYRPDQKTKGRRSRKRSSSSDSSSSSSSSSSSPERQRKTSKKRAKKSKKKSKKRKQQRSHTGSSSESSSSSTVSYRSDSSIKKGPKPSDGETGSVPKEGSLEAGKSTKQLKKEEKKRKKQVDSLMMKYLYRPESD
ncbi:hypothetical protein Chor_005778 [Crotalus horridus]